MIEIEFLRGDGGKIVEVSAKGHSGYAERGSDVVCAAVSALIQTAYLAVADITKAEYKRNDDDGYFSFTVGADCANRHDVDVILRALQIGIEDLQSGFPQFIKSEVK